MARVASRLSRKELAFIAQDIGPEIIAMMKPETFLKGLSAEKQQALFLHLLTTENLEEVIAGISPAHQKHLFGLVLQRLAADLIDETKLGGNGND
jgi:hypothetical protein